MCKLIKKTNIVPKMDNTLIVASLGRCGSTLVYDVLSLRYYNQKYRQHIIYTDDHIVDDYFYTPKTIERAFDSPQAESLRGQYKKGYVYKTHDLPPAYLPPHVKVLYLFGNPVDLVLSSKQLDGLSVNPPDERFTGLDLHIRNFRGDFSEKDKLFEKDVLRLEDNFYSWYKQQSFPLLAIRYETLWDNQDVLKEFTGYKNFKLPPQRPRKDLKSRYDDVVLEKLRGIYDGLGGQITKCDDVKIFLPSGS
jgi:hypothetical protein